MKCAKADMTKHHLFTFRSRHNGRSRDKHGLIAFELSFDKRGENSTIDTGHFNIHDRYLQIFNLTAMPPPAHYQNFMANGVWLLIGI